MRKMKCGACLKVWYLEEEDVGTVNRCPYCGKERRRQAATAEIDASGKEVQDYKGMDSEEEENPEEQYTQGKHYYDGDGVKQDYVKAVEWFRKAAEQGHIEARHMLGYCYAGGWGVKRNYGKAAEWYRKAADQGHAGSQCSLGILYRNGLGVEKDVAKATEWFRKAAEQGDYFAKSCLEQEDERVKESGTPVLEDNDCDEEPDIFGDEDDWDDDEW